MEPKELIRIRRTMRLTQGQLAERLSVHPITVARWETGGAPIGSKELEKIKRELKVNARINRKLPLDSRAYVKFLNVSPVGVEARAIEEALADRFNADRMVGHVDIELSRELDGWRVTSAWASGGHVSNVALPLRPSPDRTDWRENVIEALREAGVPLAH